MSDIAIRAEGLSKQYRLGPRERYRTLRDSLSDALMAPFRRFSRSFSNGDDSGDYPETFWALKDVSFEVRHGEVIGIIGRNGAGKSTLLKILSRITEPTEGHAHIHGRIASLLEVGTGFHPELSGRDNIFLNGAILGMKKAEIRRKFDEIVAFAEVEKFIDTPVKHYSSGMYVRLAFAVAAHLEPEILVVDEVLAVGDAQFQKKCLGKMSEVSRGGRTVIFVSHNMVAVESLCSRAILLDQGEVRAIGHSRETINEYLAQSDANSATQLADRHRKGTREIQFTAVSIVPLDSVETAPIRAGDDFEIRLEYYASTRVLRPNFSVSIFNIMSVHVFGIHTTDLNFEIPEIEGKGCIALRIFRSNLMPGRYLIHIAAGDATHPLRYDHVVDAAELEIQPADVYASGRLSFEAWTVVFLNCDWRMLPSTSESITRDRDLEQVAPV
jgi:lipopolysaccharide transport system ATP-binding protein